MVIQKYILLSSFFEDIYKKWGVTKKYKCTGQCHFRLLCTLSNVSSKQLFLIQTQFDFKTKGYAGYTASRVIIQLQIDSAFTKFFRKLLRYSTIIKIKKSAI